MDSMLQGFEGWGGALIQWAMEANISASAVLIGALLVDRVLRDRIGASWRLLLFVAVFLRALLPLDAATWGVPPGALPLEKVLGDAPWSIGAPIVESVGGVQSSQVAGSVAQVDIAWAPVVVAINWALITSLLLTWQVTARRRLARELRHARCERSVSVPERYPVPVLVHPTLGPAVVGLLHPIVVLPMRVIKQLQPVEIDCVLAHERAHVERRDPWLRMALQVTTALLWPIAALWFALARTQQLIEEACDARALLRGNGADNGLDTRTYGETLLSVASTPRLALVAPTFGGGLAARIRALGRGAPRGSQPVQSAAAIALALGLVACAGSRGADVTPVDQPPARRVIKFKGRPNDGAPGEFGIPFTIDVLDVQVLFLSGPKEVFLDAIPGSRGGTGWPRWVDVPTSRLEPVLQALNRDQSVSQFGGPRVVARRGATGLGTGNPPREGTDGTNELWREFHFDGEPGVAYTVSYDIGVDGHAYLDAQHNGASEVLACLTPGGNGVDGEYVLALMQAKIWFADAD